MTVGHSIYVKKVMKLLAFIFEQPSYCPENVVYFLHLLNILKCTRIDFFTEANNMNPD